MGPPHPLPRRAEQERPARAAFEEMAARGLADLGPRPDQACFHALADAYSRDGDVDGVEEVILRAKSHVLPLNAPYFTSLIGAHRRAGTEEVGEVCEEILERMEKIGVVQDTVLHSSIICWHLAEGESEAAWMAYHRARLNPWCAPDAVTYTAMMVACAQADRLEQARNLLMEMRVHKVYPTLPTHNAFISVCAARAASLTEMSLEEHTKLRRLGVDLDVQSPISIANTQLQTLIGDGHAPDGRTHLALLRVAAGAADVPRAQSDLNTLARYRWHRTGGIALSHVATRLYTRADVPTRISPRAAHSRGHVCAAINAAAWHRGDDGDIGSRVTLLMFGEEGPSIGRDLGLLV